MVLPYSGNSPYIHEAIESVLGQTRSPAEIFVIVRDLRHAEELRRHEGKVSVIQQVAPGLGGARNAGVAQASAQWISFLNENDLWMPERLEVMASYVEAHPGCRVIHHSVRTFGPGNEAGQVSAGSALTLQDFLVADCSPASISSVMIAREALLFSGGMNPLIKANGDHDCFLRVAIHYRFEYLDVPLATVRGPSADAPSGFREEYVARNLMLMIYETLFSSQQARRRFAAELNGRFLARAVAAGDFAAALNILGRYCRMQRVGRAGVLLQAMSRLVRGGGPHVH